MSPHPRADADADLTEAVYRCVLEPQAWDEVMAQIDAAFPSCAQTFYFLQRDSGHVRPICLRGIDPALLPHFDALYFAPDNPCMWVSQRLHRPGVVRTNERLEAVLGRRGDLYRSAYYHEWLKPQGLHFMIGNTLVCEGTRVANITLMRARDMPTFDAAEVRRFERLSRHMQRALQTAIALEAQGAALDAWQAFAAMPTALALVDTDLRLVFANPPMEQLLRRAHALALHAGRLVAPDPDAQARLALAVQHAHDTPPEPVWLPAADAPGGVLLLDLTPVAPRPGHFLPARALVMLVLRGVGMNADEMARVLGERHGCTRSEAALAVLLAQGRSLAEAGAARGLTYGSARAYLKLLFQKLGVHSQGQLVALLARLG